MLKDFVAAWGLCFLHSRHRETTRAVQWATLFHVDWCACVPERLLQTLVSDAQKRCHVLNHFWGQNYVLDGPVKSARTGQIPWTQTVVESINPIPGLCHSPMNKIATASGSLLYKEADFVQKGEENIRKSPTEKGAHMKLLHTTAFSCLLGKTNPACKNGSPEWLFNLWQQKFTVHSLFITKNVAFRAVTLLSVELYKFPICLHGRLNLVQAGCCVWPRSRDLFPHSLSHFRFPISNSDFGKFVVLVSFSAALGLQCVFPIQYHWHLPRCLGASDSGTGTPMYGCVSWKHHACGLT